MLGITQYEPLWGVWRTKKLIGEGSFGKVYRAVREEFGQKFYSAIKHISIPANESQIDDAIAEGLATDEASVKAYFDEVTQNLITEILMMHELKGTTNIVSYEDHMVVPKPGGIGSDIFIRMELLTSLNTILAHRQFTSKDVIKLGIDICTALETCSKMGIIHRDIKPSNIFVNERGDYKLGDFGVARQLENTTSGMSKKGTYIYMAPEVYRGEAANLSADTFSLGIVMYRLLNGNRAPFLPVGDERITASDNENALARRMTGEPLPAPAFADKDLADVILIATNFDRTKRFASPTEFKEALQCVAAGNHYERTLQMMDTAGEKTGSSVHGNKADINATCTAFGSASKSNIASEGTVVGAAAPTVAKKKKKTAGVVTAILAILVIAAAALAYYKDCIPMCTDGCTDRPTTTSSYHTTEETDNITTVESTESSSTTATTTTTTTTTKKTTTTTKATTTTTTVSGWVEKSEVPAGATIVNTKTQYKYKDKEFSTGSTKQKNGWEYCGTYSTSKGSVVDMGETSVEAFKNESTERVVSTYEIPKYKTVYYYTHYVWSSSNCGPYDKGGNSKHTYSSEKRLTSHGYANCSGNYLKYATSSSGMKCSKCGAYRFFYNEDSRQEIDYYVTGYKYYDITYTYDFYRWGSWSDWSDTKYTESSTRKVETRTLYKYTPK